MEAEPIRWLNAFFELFVVLAFAIGWLILEMVCRRLDRKREADLIEKAPVDPVTAKPEVTPASSEGASRHLEG